MKWFVHVRLCILDVQFHASRQLNEFVFILPSPLKSASSHPTNSKIVSPYVPDNLPNPSSNSLSMFSSNRKKLGLGTSNPQFLKQICKHWSVTCSQEVYSQSILSSRHWPVWWFRLLKKLTRTFQEMHLNILMILENDLSLKISLVKLGFRLFKVLYISIQSICFLLVSMEDLMDFSQILL